MDEAEEVVLWVVVQRVSEEAVAQPQVEVVDPQLLHPADGRGHVFQQMGHLPQRRL